MKRILALDGGGVRGLLSIQALRYIERKTGKRVHELFDLVAGSSTGAIQALGLTHPEPLSADRLQNFYTQYAASIFDSAWTSLGGFAGPQYSPAGLEATLRNVLGNTPLGQSRTAVMVTTYDIQARLPVVLASWNTFSSMASWEAARASSAGPTFFPPFGKYVDGGVVQNNPSLTALVEACRLFQCAPGDCLVLSLGTGACEAPIAPGDAQGWGKLPWLGALFSIFTDGVADLVDYQLSELLPAANYLRLQCRLSGPIAEMDNTDPANLLALRQRGNQLVAENLAALDAFITKL